MNSILLCTMFASAVGFSLSVYVYFRTKRETLEHKAMFILDTSFTASFVSALMSIIYNGSPTTLDHFIFWVTLPAVLYVSLIAAHHRLEHVDALAEDEALKERDRIFSDAERGL